MKNLIPRVVGIASRLSGWLGAELAWYLWSHPHGRMNTPLPDDAREFVVEVLHHKLEGFTLGEGSPVLLLHGWGGASTDMTPLAEELAGSGHLAIAIDLPGHGSDRRAYADVFRMAAAVDAVAGRFGSPDAVVAHSFGAVVAFAAFQHGGPRRVVLIAPAMRGKLFLEAFRQQVGLSDAAARRFRERFVSFAGPYLMDVFAGQGDVPGAGVLVLHDPADDRTPFSDAAEYAQRRPATKLVELPGTGHKGILSAPKALAEVVAFLAD